MASDEEVLDVVSGMGYLQDSGASLALSAPNAAAQAISGLDADQAQPPCSTRAIGPASTSSEAAERVACRILVMSPSRVREERSRGTGSQKPNHRHHSAN